ncbi:MAG: hypothetical protein KA010_02785 [Saprospiraceae bacterium]|nr:hypothetical protein [Saprospiraceae bacterium]
MFTINIYLRFALMAASLLIGLILTFTISFWYAIPFYLTFIVLTVGYIMLGTVQSAAELMQAGDMAAVKKRLGLTLKPEWLFSMQRSYYYMLMGTISTQTKDYEDAKNWLSKAQKTGFMSDNERATNLLQLVGIAVQKNNFTEAQQLMRKVNELKVTEPMIKNQIAEINKNMKQSQGLMRNPANRGLMVQPGGKRPRPRMR